MLRLTKAANMPKNYEAKMPKVRIGLGDVSYG
jgi:hypothetical protein